MAKQREAKQQIRNSTSRGKERRTIAVCTRLDSDEAARLDELRGKIQRGTYMRMLLNGIVPQRIPSINVQTYNVLADIQHQLENLSFSASRKEFNAAELAEVRNLLLQLRLELLDIQLE